MVVVVKKKKLLLQLFSKETTVFLRNTIGEIISEREKTGATRNDLIDTLIILKNEDKAKHSSVTDVGNMLT